MAGRNGGTGNAWNRGDGAGSRSGEDEAWRKGADRRMDKAVEKPPSIQPVTRADLRAARHADERLFADSWASTDIISDRVLFLILPEGRKAEPTP